MQKSSAAGTLISGGAILNSEKVVCGPGQSCRERFAATLSLMVLPTNWLALAEMSLQF